MRWPWQKPEPEPAPAPEPTVMVAEVWLSMFNAAVQSPSLPTNEEGEQMSPDQVADWGVRRFTERFVDQGEQGEQTGDE